MVKNVRTHTHSDVRAGVCVCVNTKWIRMFVQFDKEGLKIPGMLIIDTPGHESFRYNWRSEIPDVVHIGGPTGLKFDADPECF